MEIDEIAANSSQLGSSRGFFGGTISFAKAAKHPTPEIQGNPQDLMRISEIYKIIKIRAKSMKIEENS